MNKSLTIIVPAYKEVKNIEVAYRSVSNALRQNGIADYELLIITNNFRTPDQVGRLDDGTPAIAELIVTQNPKVKHFHNHAYVNLGYKYRQGVKAATKDYVMMIPGDNETQADSLVSILSHLGEAEIITSYTVNQEVRAFKRRFVSQGFTTLCNILFGLRMKYYNGICIHPRKLLQKVPMRSNNFAYMAEILIYLVKSGVNYKEVPMVVKPITNISTAFKLRSVFECLGTLARLFWRIHFKRERITLPAARAAKIG